jgi:hypothetical protein
MEKLSRLVKVDRFFGNEVSAYLCGENYHGKRNAGIAIDPDDGDVHHQAFNCVTSGICIEQNTIYAMQMYSPNYFRRNGKPDYLAGYCPENLIGKGLSAEEVGIMKGSKST